MAQSSSDYRHGLGPQLTVRTTSCSKCPVLLLDTGMEAAGCTSNVRQHLRSRVLFEEFQHIEIGVLGRGSPAERKRSAVIINGPSQQQREKKKKAFREKQKIMFCNYSPQLPQLQHACYTQVHLL